MSLTKIPLPESVFRAAEQRIAWVLDNFSRVCVSFSGGKDSTLMLHLAACRARQQRKKQGRPAAPTGDSYDLSPDQIEELDLDDYDTYESALKQELNRTIAQTKQEQKNPNRKAT